MSSTTDGVAELTARCHAAERRVEELERAMDLARNGAHREVDTALADLRLAQRIARIGNWTLDPEVGVPEWSDQIFTIYERDPDLGPIPLADYSALYCGADLERFTSAITAAIELGTPYDIELSPTLPSGTRKWVHAICEPEPDPGPAGHRLRGTIQDITARREAENRLHASEERFRTLVEGAMDIVFAVDAEGRYTYVSPNWPAHLGEPADAALGSSIEDYIHPDDYRRCLAFFREVLETGTKRPSPEYRVRRADGEVRWYVSTGSATRDATGAVTGAVGIARDVTEERQAKDALAASEARYRRLAEQFPDGALFLVGRDRRYLSANGRSIARAGLTSEQVIGRTVREVFPEVCHVVEPNMARAFAGESVTYELEYRGRLFASHAVPGSLQDGSVDEVLIVTRDITESKQAEAALRAQQKMLADAERLAHVGSWVWHVKEDRWEFSESWLAIHGCDSAPEGIDEVLPLAYPDDLDAIKAAMETAVSGYAPYEVEHRIIRRDTGEVRVVRAYGESTKHGDGEVVTLSGAAQDVTEQRRAEAELRESEERFRALLDNVAMVSVQGYAPDGTTIFWNEGSHQLYGYSREEALGRSLLDLIIPPEMRSGVSAAIEEMAQTGVPIPSSELELMRKDGSRVTVYSSHCILMPRGRPQELFCIDVDLTKVRAAESEREALREQLAQAQKLESVGRLAGGVAHDFNNMLSVILGHVEIANLAMAPDAPERSHLEEIRKAGERSANLVRQLLAFARRQTVVPKHLDVNETIVEMLAMLRRLIGENIELVWSPGKDLEPVRMDPAQIDQLLANLVVNARDAIDGVGRIEISTRPVARTGLPADVAWDRGVAVEVRDDGHGMDAVTRDQIFEPFFTTKGVGEGTGLGLATVYGIVKQNRGTISVESSPGAGACFTVTFPAASPDAGDLIPARFDDAEVPKGTETVLLVEDEVAIVSMGRSMLEKLGYRVLTAENPAEAVRMAKQHQRDLRLVLTDVVMPQMDGRSLARLLTEEIPDLSVLYMSGYTADVISEQGVLDEGVRFLAKPFSLHDLAVAVRSALDERAD
jgi:PAS domain S-box-containing protein